MIRKIQAHALTPDSWILQEWGNRIGILSTHAHTWHMILLDHQMLNTSLAECTNYLKCELEFVNAESDTDTTPPESDLEGLPTKHAQCHNVHMSPRVSYTKTVKGATRYAAGYWCIQFDTGWSGALCPKCVTLDQYPHEGPYAHKLEMHTFLLKLRKESQK